MKQKLGFIIGGMLAIIILGVGIAYSNTSQAEAALSTEDIRKMVKEQYPGEITEIEQETEFNRTVYEVEIKTDDKEYEIKLDGKTGEILNVSEKPIKEKLKVNNDKKNEKVKDTKEPSKEEKVADKKATDKKVAKTQTDEQPKKVVINEKKDEKSNHTKDKDQKSDQPKQEQKPKEKKKEEPVKEPKKEPKKKAIITIEEAKKIALGAFSGTIDDIELDTEDGRLIYEVEIERGDKEAEIEIDAYTGEIIVLEIDED